MKRIICVIFLSGMGLTGCAKHQVVQEQPTVVTQTAMQALTSGVNIQFPTNSNQIDVKYEDVLAGVSELLSKNTALILDIQGHTDSSGANVINNRLALARANAVRAILISNYGVSAEQLNTIGFGFTKPVASNATEEGRAENRRVTLLLKGR